MNTINPFQLDYTPEVFDTLRRSKLSVGVFQLGASKTAHFVHGYKKIDTEHHIVALNALLRPSCMDVELDDGKTIAEHYVRRLNGEEEVTYLHPSLEPILKESYGIAIFQEQNIRITADVAGFDLVKADLMRQAIGKKDFVKMESMRQDFIKGCKETSGIEEDVAEQIFEQIRASGRYQFNQCISGKERIIDGINGQSTDTIKEMFQKQSFIGKKCLSLKDKELFQNDIVDIRYASIQSLYRVTTEDGCKITVTDNHKFPTQDGEKELKYLTLEDSLYTMRVLYPESGHRNERNTHTDLSKIDSITCVGRGDVYDVEVSGNISHTFLTTGGIVTSNSHATSYGQMSCIDLWFRYHYPHLFFATQISYTMINVSDKTKRNRLIKDLIRSAKERNIDTVLPSIDRRNVHTDFSVEDNKIYMGFNCISGTGSGTLKDIFGKITQIEEERGKEILDHTWLEILLYFSKAIGKKAMIPWISLGIFDNVIDHRTGALNDYNDWLLVSGSKVATKWMAENPQITFADTLKAMVHSDIKLTGDLKQKIRTVYDISIQNRPKKTSSDWLYKQEETLLGVVLGQLKVQVAEATEVNTTLDELDKPKKNCSISIYVTEVSMKKQKDNKDMAFLTGLDQEGNESSSICVFGTQFQQYADLLYQGAHLLIEGYVSDRGSFVVEKARHLQE